MNITIDEVKANHKVRTYIERADESLIALGYTEHSYAHVTHVAQKAKEILETLGYPQRDCELAEIAGFLHDIGNVINRVDHAQSGAVMAFRILDEMGFSAEETSTIITAIGNHDEGTAAAVTPLSAALILADKSDVRRSRVRSTRSRDDFDIHDRVNFAAESSRLLVDPEEKIVTLSIRIDTGICAVMDYFEIFLQRMTLCRSAAAFLGLTFELVINETRML